MECLFNALPLKVKLERRCIVGYTKWPLLYLARRYSPCFMVLLKSKKSMEIFSFMAAFKWVEGGGVLPDLFCWILDFGIGNDFKSFVLICWSMCFTRNKFVFEGMFSTPKVIGDCECRYWMNFLLSSPKYLHPHNQ